MPELNLGTSFNDANEYAEAARAKVSPGPHKFQCEGVAPGEYRSGKKYLQFDLTVIEDSEPTMNGKTIQHRVPLPEGGETKGIGFLVEVTNALGKPWEGTSLKTEDYIGRQCNANVIHTEPNENGNSYANIKSFF